MKHPKHAWRENSWDPSGVSPKQLQELGLSSVQELKAGRDARTAARLALAHYLARPEVSGPDKQRARCAYIHEFGRLPYQCRGCWLLPGNCVCGRLRVAAPATKVVIHLHQDEWGRGSNTGCLCASSLSGAVMLLRGHAPHDTQLADLLADPSTTPALLWPGDDALEPHQLQEVAAGRSGGHITLVAIDATWAGAVKMRRKYPPGILTVRLPPDLALPELHHVRPVIEIPPPERRHTQGSNQEAGAATNGQIDSSSTSRLQHQQHQQVQQQAQQQTQQEQQQQQQHSQPSNSHENSSSQQAQLPGSPRSQPTDPHLAPLAYVTPGANDVTPGDDVTPDDVISAGDGSSSPVKGPKHLPSPGERVSLFRGVRKYHGKAADNGRVSTLEAVAAALLALEGDEGVYQGLLYNLKLKVDGMRAQKHMPLVYGLVGGDESEGGDVL